MLKSTVSGVVGTVGDPAVLADGEVLLDIAGGSGYVIRAVVGELSLEKLAVGSMMNVFSYETGVSCTGRVSEIGDIPVSGYYDGGNGNSSGYIVTVRVEDPDVQLKNWEGVELSMITDGMNGGSLFLDCAYVREQDGESYVMAARDGVLVRERVATGRTMYNYIEILSPNLTLEDYIAFPYSKEKLEGAPVRMPDGADADIAVKGGYGG